MWSQSVAYSVKILGMKDFLPGDHNQAVPAF